MPEGIRPGTLAQNLQDYAYYLVQAYNRGLISSEEYTELAFQARELVRIIATPTTAKLEEIPLAYQALYRLPYFKQAMKGRESIDAYFRFLRESLTQQLTWTPTKPRPGVVPAPEVELPSAAEPAAIYQEVISQLPTPALQAHYGRMFSQLFTEFGGTKAWQGWLENRYQRAIELEKKIRHYKKRRKEVERVAVPMAGRAALQPVFKEQRKSIGAKIRRLVEQRGQFGVDPFSAWLADYPFYERFMRQTPEQRGFYSSRYVPFTRWLL